jgi:hypothetical protein
MEGNGFRTLGESEFGNVWFVEGEGKVVVNAYQAALYFGVDDFMQFAGMIADARRRLGTDREPPPPPPPPPTNSKIRQFRPAPRDD